MILPHFCEVMDSSKFTPDAVAGLVNPQQRMPPMDQIISAPIGSVEGDLGQYWGRYFAEIPTCTHPDCERIAHEVDPFFPYLDDHNRCRQHRADEPSGARVLS
jgi:hypothetical protein